VYCVEIRRALWVCGDTASAEVDFSAFRLLNLTFDEDDFMIFTRNYTVYFMNRG